MYTVGMELSCTTDKLFQELPKVKSKKLVSNLNPDSQPAGMSRDARTLEKQLNDHLRMRYKQQTRVALYTPRESTVDDIQDFLQGQEKPKRSWKTLPMYEKWQLLQGATTDATLLSQYRIQLRKGTLEATYDPETKEISNIRTKET